MKEQQLFRAFCFAVLTSASALSAPVCAREVLLLTGANGSSQSKYYYLGGVIPLQSQKLSDDGVRVRLWSAWKDFDYTGLPISQNVNVDGPELEAEAGYQWSLGPNTFVAGYVGALWRDLRASPNDPSRRHDDGFFPKAQIEFATRRGSFSLSTIGSYTFDAQDYWARVRPAYILRDTLHLGPEVAVLGGRGYDRQQFGLFIDGIRLGAAKVASVFHGESLGFRLGVEHDSRVSTNRWYGGVSFAVHFF